MRDVRRSPHHHSLLARTHQRWCRAAPERVSGCLARDCRGADRKPPDRSSTTGGLETLQDLRREGKTQAIGCCAWGGEYPSVCEILNSGAFDTVLVGYSLLNPTSGRPAPAGFCARDFLNVMQVAADNGTSSIVLRVLESGMLAGVAQPHPTSGQARSPSREFAQNVERARALHFLVREDQSLAQAAIRFALGDPRVGVVLVGFSAMDQVGEVAAAANGARFSATDLERLEALYASDFLREGTGN